MGRLLIVSNRLPVSVTRDSGALRISRSSGGLATGLGGVHAGLRERLAGLVGRRQRRAQRRRGEAARRSLLRRALAGARPAQRRRGRPLLREVLQRRVVARPPLHDRPAAARGAGLRSVRAGEPPLRRGGGGELPARRPHLGARLPADAGATDDPRADPRRPHRLFPPHPLPRLGRLPDPPLPRAPAGRDAGRRPGRLPHRRVHAPLRRGRPAPPGGVHRRGSHALGATAGAGGRVPDGRRRRRLRPAVRLRRRASRGPASCGARPRTGTLLHGRHGPPRLHQGHPPPPAGLRAPAAPAPGAARARAAGAGGGPLAHQRRALPGVPVAGRHPDRPHPRPVRHPQLGAGPLHVPGPARARRWWRCTGRPT